jgi:hypothetical protein
VFCRQPGASESGDIVGGAAAGWGSCRLRGSGGGGARRGPGSREGVMGLLGLGTAGPSRCVPAARAGIRRRAASASLTRRKKSSSLAGEVGASDARTNSRFGGSRAVGPGFLKLAEAVKRHRCSGRPGPCRHFVPAHRQAGLTLTAGPPSSQPRQCCAGPHLKIYHCKQLFSVISHHPCGDWAHRV